MRMRRSRKKTIHLKRKVSKTDKEGGKYAEYLPPVSIQATVWHKSGVIQAEMYGERLNYILNMLYDGKEVITEGDSICAFVKPDQKPDYRVISIKPYSPAVLELEKII